MVFVADKKKRIGLLRMHGFRLKFILYASGNDFDDFLCFPVVSESSFITYSCYPSTFNTLRYAHRKHSHEPERMDSLIPFTTSGSLVDCVDSTSARAPAPRAQSCASLPSSLLFLSLSLPRKDARHPERWSKTSWRAALL